MAAEPSTEGGSPSGSSTSPGTRSMDSKPFSTASEPGLTRHRTRKPCARRARTTACPTKPVAPVTKTRVHARSVARGHAIFAARCGAPTSYHGACRGVRAVFSCAVAAPLFPSVAVTAAASTWSQTVDARCATRSPPATCRATSSWSDRAIGAPSQGRRLPARDRRHVEPMTADTIFDIASAHQGGGHHAVRARGSWTTGKLDLTPRSASYLKEFTPPPSSGSRFARPDALRGHARHPALARRDGAEASRRRRGCRRRRGPR